MILQPYGGQWRIFDEDPGTTTPDRSMDDTSAWAEVTAPVGEFIDPDYTYDEPWLPVATLRPTPEAGTRFWLALDLTGRPLQLIAHADIDALVYYDGELIAFLGGGGTGGGHLGNQVVNLPRYPGHLAIDCRQAVRAGLDGLYFDAQITAASERPAVRQYPRDDGAGHSPGPRIHPPPKARRLVGGYQ